MTSSLADRINELFDVLERPESVVAEQVSHRCGQTFTVQILRELRSGARGSAPTPQLRALEEVFGVAAGFLTSSAGDDSVSAQLRLLRAVRDHGIRNTAFCGRLVADPGGVDALNALTALISQVERPDSP